MSWFVLFAAAHVGAVSSSDAPLQLECIDDAMCATWVSAGDTRNCSEYPSLLHLHCPKICGTCESHAVYRRCLSSGDVLASSPTSLAAFADGVSTAIAAWPGAEAKVEQRHSPLLLQMDHFLSPAEALSLIAAAESAGFNRGSRYIDGDAELRTSATMFCRGACMWSPSVARLVDRVAAATGISAWHFEQVQFVRYSEGQYYAEHSDFIAEDADSISGPRLLTFFIYLSEGFVGGETAFPKLELRLSPAVGRMALWTNAIVYVGGKSRRLRWLPDGKTNHEALPVQNNSAGSAKPKYAVNIWMHNGNFRHVEHYAERCKVATASPPSVKPGGDPSDTSEL